MRELQNLHGNLYNLKPTDFFLERVSSYKILGYTIREHFGWN